MFKGEKQRDQSKRPRDRPTDRPSDRQRERWRQTEKIGEIMETKRLQM